MRVVIAPDSFKGSCSAPRAAAALAEGLRAGWPELAPDLLPIADGGEGTVEALVSATGGRLVEAEARDPLGRPIKATYGVLGEGNTAVIEMAAASGLPLLTEAERNPELTSTLGTGDLIRHALDLGCRRLLLGIGGSATNDAGLGMAVALGTRLYSEAGIELEPSGAALSELASLDLSELDPRLAETEVLVACDVTNPLFGPHGAAHVYAPQKGASPEQVARLDAGLARFAEVVRRDLGLDLAELPGAGAAGGLGAGLVAFCGARLSPGADLVLDTVHFEERLAGARLVITGEGKLDAQTAYGKAIARVAARAKLLEIPVVAVVGSVEADTAALARLGLAAALPLVQGPITLELAMRDAEALLQAAGERLAQLLRLGSIL